MFCTILATMARPRPAPVAAVRAVSPRKKGRVRLGSCSGETPGPLSRTRSDTMPSRAVAATRTRAMPVPGVLP